jgi:hypothetical protein
MLALFQAQRNASPGQVDSLDDECGCESQRRLVNTTLARDPSARIRSEAVVLAVLAQASSPGGGRSVKPSSEAVVLASSRATAHRLVWRGRSIRSRACGLDGRPAGFRPQSAELAPLAVPPGRVRSATCARTAVSAKVIGLVPCESACRPALLHGLTPAEPSGGGYRCCCAAQATDLTAPASRGRATTNAVIAARLVDFGLVRPCDVDLKRRAEQLGSGRCRTLPARCARPT